MVFEQDLQILFERIKLLLVPFQLLSDLLKTSFNFSLVQLPTIILAVIFWQRVRSSGL